eukprot:gene5164-15373_t
MSELARLNDLLAHSESLEGTLNAAVEFKWSSELGTYASASE